MCRAITTRCSSRNSGPILTATYPSDRVNLPVYCTFRRHSIEQNLTPRRNLFGLTENSFPQFSQVTVIGILHLLSCEPIYSITHSSQEVFVRLSHLRAKVSERCPNLATRGRR